jgi:hypothetical protein
MAYGVRAQRQCVNVRLHWTDFTMTQPHRLYGLEIPYAKSVEELIQLTRERPPSCWNAYTALAYNQSEKAINALNELLNSKDWTHIRSAIEAIGKNINGLQLEDKLINFLNNANGFIVTATIKALSNLKSKKGHDKIKTLTSSDIPEIKEAAIKGLSGVWQVSDFGFLLSLNKIEGNGTIRKSIGFVLAEHVDSKNWKQFFDSFCKDTISRHRELALSIAHEFSKDKTLIQTFLNDKDGHIRKKAKLFMDTVD